MALSDGVPAIALHTAIAPISTRTSGDGKAITNTILLSLPDEEFTLLRPSLEYVDLPRYKVLYEQGEKIENLYFLNDGMISLVVLSNDGRSVEVGICGRNGVVGVPPLFGIESASTRAIVQMPGQGVCIGAAELSQLLPECPVLGRVMVRFVLMNQMEVAQTAACNRLHEMDQRLARWLLMCQDTVDSGALPLTHEFIAQMLGTGRPTVTIAAGVLERAGLIQNARGSVRILNRKRLEDVACECYGAIQSFRSQLTLQ